MVGFTLWTVNVHIVLYSSVELSTCVTLCHSLLSPSQTVLAAPKLTAFAMGILTRLVSKRVWERQPLWEGFIKCCEITLPHSIPVMLQLPVPQLEQVMKVSPKLSRGLREHVRALNAAGGASSLPRNVLAVLMQPATPAHTPSTATPRAPVSTPSAIGASTPVPSSSASSSAAAPAPSSEEKTGASVSSVSGVEMHAEQAPVGASSDPRLTNTVADTLSVDPRLAARAVVADPRLAVKRP